MEHCDLCGNSYDKTFEVHLGGVRHVFDSFECAIHMLAPSCAHCGCRILGHGLEAEGVLYCCAHAPAGKACNAWWIGPMPIIRLDAVIDRARNGALLPRCPDHAGTLSLRTLRTGPKMSS